VKLWLDEGGGGASPSDPQQVFDLDLVDQIAIGHAGQQATIWLRVDAPVHLAGRDRAKNIALVSRLSVDEQNLLLNEGRKRALSLISRHAVAVDPLPEIWSPPDQWMPRLSKPSGPSPSRARQYDGRRFPPP
jgi:hypothetical protein